MFRQGISRPYLTLFERSITRSSWFRIDTRACTSIVDESRIFTMPNSASSASRCGVTTRALASARRTHYTITGLRSTTEKDFPRLLDARPKRSGGTEIEDDDVIFGMVDRLFERQFQFDPTPSAQPALEYR